MFVPDRSKPGSHVFGDWHPPSFLPEGRREIPEDPRLRDLLAYWRTCAAGAEMPTREATFPVRVASVLPYIYVLDVLEGSFRYRLRGTEVDGRFGSRRTGLAIEEFGYAAEAEVEAFRARHAACVDARAPIVAFGRVQWGGPSYATAYESIKLPIMGPSGEVRYLLCAVVLAD